MVDRDEDRGVFVTGAAGFVGANLVAHLARAGVPVVAWDRAPLPPGFLAALGDAAERVRVETGDLANRAGVEATISAAVGTGYRRIVHAGAVTPTPEQEQSDPAAVVAVNLMGTVHVLEAARRAGAARVIVVSSDAVYGPPADADALTPVSEDAPTRATGLYARCKVAAEELARYYRETHGLSVAAARLGAVYGPWERVTATRGRLSAVAAVVAAVQAAQAVQAGQTYEPLTVHGAARRRDWVHAADVADALARLAFASRLTWDTYNIGSGRAQPLSAALDAAAIAVPGFVWADSAMATAAATISTAGVRAPLALSRLAADTGYAPRYDVAAGVASLLNDHRTGTSRPDDSSLPQEI